jgi:hypothetical protein
LASSATAYDHDVTPILVRADSFARFGQLASAWRQRAFRPSSNEIQLFNSSKA